MTSPKILEEPKADPGRITTLTLQEELKLREMWVHILVFMELLPEDLARSTTLSSIVSKEKKKKKLGIFSRGKDSNPSAENTSVIAQEKLKNSLGDIKPSELRKVLWSMIRADNIDNLLLRFLRARKWKVADALQMLGTTLKWRVDNNVEQIVREQEKLSLTMEEVINGIPDNEHSKDIGKNSEPISNGTVERDLSKLNLGKTLREEIELQFRSKKAYVYGHDLKGRPIVHVRPVFHEPKAQSEKSSEIFTILIIEDIRLCLRDPVDSAAVVFDLSDFGMSNMDYPAVKFMIKCFEAHYPESLGFVLVHKAPWIFQGIWNVIKKWLDPVVAAKISFTRSHDDMLEFISEDFIPKDLSGSREYEYEYIEPKDGEDSMMDDATTKQKLLDERTNLLDEYEKSLISWIQAENDDERAKHASVKLAVCEKLRLNYWQIDPYIRVRSPFDRAGVPALFHEELRNGK